MVLEETGLSELASEHPEKSISSISIGSNPGPPGSKISPFTMISSSPLLPSTNRSTTHPLKTVLLSRRQI